MTAKAIEAFGRDGTARSRRDESAVAQPFAERKGTYILDCRKEMK